MLGQCNWNFRAYHIVVLSHVFVHALGIFKFSHSCKINSGNFGRYRPVPRIFESLRGPLSHSLTVWFGSSIVSPSHICVSTSVDGHNPQDYLQGKSHDVCFIPTATGPKKQHSTCREVFPKCKSSNHQFSGATLDGRNPAPPGM